MQYLFIHNGPPSSQKAVLQSKLLIMPWEKRARGGRYYTRSRRHRGKIIRQYFGHGEKGRKAALEDASKRADRALRAKARRQQQFEYENTLNEVRAFEAVSDQITHAILQAAGYHAHKGSEWRKKRHGN